MSSTASHLGICPVGCTEIGPDCIGTPLAAGRSRSLPPSAMSKQHVPQQPKADAARSKDDLLVQLLQQVMTLTADNRCLVEQNAGLQKENLQLNTLVADLSDTLQQQQQQARLLLQLQRQQLLNATGRLLPAAAPQLEQQVNTQQQQQLQAKQWAKDAPRSSKSSGTAAATAGRTAAPCARPAQDQQEEEEEDCPEVSACLPVMQQQQQAQARHQQQQQAQSSQQQQQQERVAEWLQERGWQEWQGRLPLEPASSSSSSSSLMLAVEAAFPGRDLSHLIQL